MASIKSPLSLTEQELLDKFIIAFLPKRGNRLKHSGNELTFINTTLSRIFGKWFFLHPTTRDLLDAFDRLGYEIFSREGIWDAEAKQFKPVADKQNSATKRGNKDNDSMFIYIDVDAPLVRQLKLTTTGLPPSASPEKKQQTEEMIQKILLFQKSIRK